jgi:hypothetical protein
MVNISKNTDEIASKILFFISFIISIFTLKPLFDDVLFVFRGRVFTVENDRCDVLLINNILTIIHCPKLYYEVFFFLNIYKYKLEYVARRGLMRFRSWLFSYLLLTNSCEHNLDASSK